MTETTLRVNTGNFWQKTVAATIEHDAHAPVATARTTAVTVSHDLVIPVPFLERNWVPIHRERAVGVTEDLSTSVRHLFERLRSLGAGTNSISIEGGSNVGVLVGREGQSFLDHLGYLNPSGLQRGASAGTRSAVEAATLVEHESAGVLSKLARIVR